jgi:ribosomal protein S18 acetylase RimI-like enzyme
MSQVRLAKIEDIESISNVLALSWKTAYRGIVHDEYLDALKYDHWVEFFATGLGNGSLFSMVIEENQEMIGAAVLCNTEKAREASLLSFYLLPEKIGMGFGHAFFSAIESELVGRSYLNCIIDVLENNARAIRFYKAHGYQDAGSEIIAVLGELNYTCKVFVKALCEELNYGYL